MAADFYPRLPPVPDGWVAVLTDVVGSVKAVQGDGAGT